MSIENKHWLFYRDYQYYTGGQQKVADYFSHIESVTEFQAAISFSSNSVFDQDNPWKKLSALSRVEFNPADYDYIFLAGMDWEKYLASSVSSKPVINLIQHVRHADPSETLYQFLSEPAIRICVSDEVAQAITATGRVNGPVYVVPNGVDLPKVDVKTKTTDVIIVGLKNPILAGELAIALAQLGLSITLVEQRLPRLELLNKMQASRIAIVLPHKTEGFYLPALEAMHYCDIAIVPDCIGNRGFCYHQKNCLMPTNTHVNDFAFWVNEAMNILQNESRKQDLKYQALETVSHYSVARERAGFLQIALQVDQIWSSKTRNNIY